MAANVSPGKPGSLNLKVQGRFVFGIQIVVDGHFFANGNIAEGAVDESLLAKIVHGIRLVGMIIERPVAKRDGIEILFPIIDIIFGDIAVLNIGKLIAPYKKTGTTSTVCPLTIGSFANTPSPLPGALSRKITDDCSSLMHTFVYRDRNLNPLFD